MITEPEILAAARSDAKFDGRDYDAMPRHERERYFARSEAALTAAENVIDLDGRRVRRLRNLVESMFNQLSPNEQERVVRETETICLNQQYAVKEEK